MNTNELYLKTAFCCMACDGDIAIQEVELVKTLAKQSEFFNGLNIEILLSSYVEEVNSKGRLFLTQFLYEIDQANLSEAEELSIIEIAIRTIESDNKVEYSEISFFKKLRLKLKLSDEIILEKYPDKEDFLLPDIVNMRELDWGQIQFNNLVFRG